jgi:hypothetical protein
MFVGHVDNVTTRVLALTGFQAVLHHTAISVLPPIGWLLNSEMGNSDTGPLPQQYEGGLASKVWLVVSSGV